MQKNSFIEISLDVMMQQIKELVTGRYDLVVAIGRGGILPGYLAARYLDIPLEIIYLHFRNEQHQQELPEPCLTKEIDFSVENKKILLFDDVANSGKTLNVAKKFLFGAVEITTAVISGNADISLTGPHDCCIKWPWTT